MNTYVQPSPPPQVKKNYMKELFKIYIAKHGYEILVNKDEEEYGCQKVDEETGDEVDVPQW